MQICYNLLHQHAYEPTRPFGSILEADKQGLGVVTMRTLTSGILQKWLYQVNPANDFDYTPALLQFVLSNPLVDVALVGLDELVQQLAQALVERAQRHVAAVAVGGPVLGVRHRARAQQQAHHVGGLLDAHARPLRKR